MQELFEAIYTRDYYAQKIIDLIDFKAREVEPIIKKIENNYLKYITLNNDSISFNFSPCNDTFIGNYQNKKIESIEVKLNEDYEIYAFKETDITSDLIEIEGDKYGIEEANRMQHCIDENNECNYIDNYSFSLDVVVSLEELN